MIILIGIMLGGILGWGYLLHNLVGIYEKEEERVATIICCSKIYRGINFETIKMSEKAKIIIKYEWADLSAKYLYLYKIENFGSFESNVLDKLNIQEEE